MFFADSGSVSVEVAIKMCLQYQRSQGHASRTRLMTVRGGYHGDTFGAMAVTDPAGSMHQLWADVLPEHVFADRPPATLTEEYAAHLARLAAQHADTLAAIIVEPVVQGAGGMHFYDPEVLSVLRAICDEHGLLLVFDEIATGFGRTGELFGADHAGISPGHHDRRQGPDRRLPDPGRRAVHEPRRARHLQRRGPGADARPDVHGQSAGLRGRLRLDRAAARRTAGARRSPASRSC